jgi:putative transposase
MPNYRRPWLPGRYFVTIVTYHRQRIFDQPAAVRLWRAALAQTKRERYFALDSGVVLPDHVHLLVTLPAGETDLSSRVGRAKALFSRWYGRQLDRPASKIHRRERAVWQRRFYEHWIRNDAEYRAYMDYVHYNPVHHGYVSAPRDWPWSSFHRWVRRKMYSPHWGRAVDCCAMQRLAEHTGE